MLTIFPSAICGEEMRDWAKPLSEVTKIYLVISQEKIAVSLSLSADHIFDLGSFENRRGKEYVET